MAGRSRAAAAAGLSIAVGSLAGCIAPDVEVIGALGVTVDREHRPVVVVEACDGAAAEVGLFFDRNGLADDEENVQVAVWSSDPATPGASELVLHAPVAPWVGEAVAVVGDRGYIVTAAGQGDREVLGQVAFRGVNLAVMEPATVYTNGADPDNGELVGRSAEDFTADVCGR